ALLRRGNGTPSFCRDVSWSLVQRGDRQPSAASQGHTRSVTLPLFAICLGTVLPWNREAQSGVLSNGKYALAFALAGLVLYALASRRRVDLRWWRVVSALLAVGCLALAVDALRGYGALGAILTAIGAAAWLIALGGSAEPTARA